MIVQVETEVKIEVQTKVIKAFFYVPVKIVEWLVRNEARVKGKADFSLQSEAGTENKLCWFDVEVGIQS